MKLRHNLVLIGFMGTMKSALGYALAKRLGVGFLDTNDFIEVRQYKSAQHIQNIHGQEYLSALERHVVSRACDYNGIVIACGGAIPYDPANMARLRRNGFIIWLTSSPTDIIERAGGRPLLSGKTFDQMHATIHESAAVYSRYCDMVFDTSGEADRKAIYDLSLRLHRELAEFKLPIHA